MKKIILSILILTVSIVSAQKIKVKKNNILLDNQKLGSFEYIKIGYDGKGLASWQVGSLSDMKTNSHKSYYRVNDVNNKHVFNVKESRHISRYFGERDTSFLYALVKSVTKNDSLAIESDEKFNFTKKGIAKYLVRKKLINSSGVNDAVLESLLSSTNTVPKHILKRIEKEDEYIKNMGYKVDRKLDEPLFVVKSPKQKYHSRSVIDNKVIQSSVDYDIYQGADAENKKLIGHAYFEVFEKVATRLIIVNTKEAPLVISSRGKQYKFFPLEQMKTEVKEMLPLSYPFPAIYQLAQILIEKGML